MMFLLCTRSSVFEGNGFFGYILVLDWRILSILLSTLTTVLPLIYGKMELIEGNWMHIPFSK